MAPGVEGDRATGGGARARFARRRAPGECARGVVARLELLPHRGVLPSRRPLERPRGRRTLAPVDDTFLTAIGLFDCTAEEIAIPYEDTTLPGYLYLVDDSGAPRPTVVYNSGYDSTLEESYFAIVAAALARGYNVLAFDGPGQGAALCEQRLVFRHDCEAVITPVIDFALTRPEIEPGRIALFGYSLGGFLVARAAAFDDRVAALILDDGIHDFDTALAGTTLVTLRESDGAGEHCHMGAMGRAHQVIFDWLDDVLAHTIDGLDCPGESLLAPRLVHGDRGGAGQIQRPPTGQHRNAYLPSDVRIGQRRGVKSGGFRTEQQHVTRAVVHVGEGRLGVRGEREHPGRRYRRPGARQIGVHGHRRQVVVVQAGAPQLGFGQVESQRFDQMQFASGDRGHPDRIAGVGCDTRRVEHHLEQDTRPFPVRRLCADPAGRAGLNSPWPV
ncbi:MAG: hypothetical protein QOF25_1990 [Mycobacterium sp.]|nr:hypothetical protein [Mycobacterium sp.]